MINADRALKVCARFRTAFLTAVSALTLAIVSSATAQAQFVGANGGSGGNGAGSTPGIGGTGGAAGDGSFTGGAGGVGGINGVGSAGLGPAGGSTGSTGAGTGRGGGTDSGGGGASSSIGSNAGGGGGGGGGGRGATVTSTLTNGATVTGGSGGNGGNAEPGGSEWAGGGGGGGGGAGLVLDGTSISNSGIVSGGSGGNGGVGGGPGYDRSLDDGTGGSGGSGIVVNTTTGATITNSGSITGGNGGLGFGPQGAAGVGISGQNLTIINSGTIVAGAGAGSIDALRFTGGANTLTFGNPTSGLTGNIAIQAGSLNFAQPTAVTVANNIIGAGTVIKSGAGILTLTGNKAYTGATTVAGGTLLVNGSIASSANVTVAAGAVLGGTGTLPTTVINGGTLSPGNSPGTITVNGNLTFNAGSVYLVEVQGAVADRVNVSGSGALAGTLRLVPLGGAYNFATPYTLLSATGGRTGTFETVEKAGSFGAGVATAISYTTNTVLLTLTPNQLATLGVSAPANAASVAAAIDSAVLNGGDPSSLFGIYNLPAGSIPAAVNSLSGEVHTAAPAMATAAADQFLRTMLDPMTAGRLTDLGGPGPGTSMFSGLDRKGIDVPAKPTRLDAPIYSVWGSTFGSYGRSDANATRGSARQQLDDAHLATGVDVRLMPGTVAGLAVSGGRANASLPGLTGKVDADVFQAGAYGVTQFGLVKLGAAASYARLDNDVSRAIPALGSTLSTSYATTAWSGRLQATAALASWNGLTLSPLAAIQATRARSPAVTEANWAGANAGALALGKRNDITSRSEVGGQIDVASTLGGVAVNGYVRAAWAHYFQRDADLTASLVGLPGASFAAIGARRDRDSALVAAGIRAKLTERISLGVNLDGEFSGNSRRLGGSAQLRVSF